MELSCFLACRRSDKCFHVALLQKKEVAVSGLMDRILSLSVLQKIETSYGNSVLKGA
jgi:hypothetical protein